MALPILRAIFEPSRAVQALQDWAQNLVAALTDQVLPNVPKAWGYVTTDGNGKIALVNSSGVRSAVIFDSATVRVTLSRAMADTNYAVLFGSRDAAPTRVYAVDPDKTTTTYLGIEIATASTGSMRNPSTSANAFCFAVYGELA